MLVPVADLVLLALALSVDAFVVALSYGLVIRQNRLGVGLKLSLSTGLGQFVMPLAGFLLTESFYGYIDYWAHWLGFGVFAILGVKLMSDAWRNRQNQEGVEHDVELRLPLLLTLGIATSIDALVAGLGMYLHGVGAEVKPLFYLAVLAAGVIGAITFICTGVAFFVTHKIAERCSVTMLNTFAGCILIVLGVKLLV